MSLLSTVPCPHCNGSGREIDLAAVLRFIERKQLTNTALAQHLHVSAQYVSCLRSGRRRWTPHLVQRLTEGAYEQICSDTP